MLIGASHGEGLPRTSGTVGEYTCVEAFDHRVQEAIARAFVDLLGVALLVEDPVKEVTLLLASVKHVRVFLSLLFAFQFDFVQNHLR